MKREKIKLELQHNFLIYLLHWCQQYIYFLNIKHTNKAPAKVFPTLLQINIHKPNGQINQNLHDQISLKTKTKSNYLKYLIAIWICKNAPQS